MAAAYADVELTILPAEDGSYPLAICVEPGDMRASGQFVPPYTAAEIDRALEWMEQGDAEAARVREFGSTLFGALFNGGIGAVYERAAKNGDLPLRIRLVIDPPEIARIPWELLYDPGRMVFLALQGPLVRSGSFPEPTRPLDVQLPLRLLVVSAFPSGMPPLDGPAEEEAIREALAGLETQGRVAITTLQHATLEKLQNALREAADPAHPQPFHILHFIGHGRHDSATGDTALLFEDDTGDIDAVNSDDLANVLRPHDLKLVFVNACQSLQSSAFGVSGGLAPALLASGIPALIGMQVSVYDQVATGFARHFYTALADSQPVDAALAQARQLARGGGSDMGVPVCYLRAPDGKLFDLKPPARARLSPATWRLWLQQQTTPGRVFGAVATLIGLASGVLGIVQFVSPAPTANAPTPTPIPIMTGSINIAVAAFAPADPAAPGVDPGCAASSNDALGMSNQISTVLQREMQQFVGQTDAIEVAPPANTGVITDGNAAAWAKQVNADVVLYGTVRCTNSPRTSTLMPVIYISGRKFDAAAHQELVGRHLLGPEITTPGLPTSGVTRSALVNEMTKRVAALGTMVIGIEYYTNGTYDEALASFTEADKALPQDTAGTSGTELRAALNLFLGTSAGNLGRMDDARTYYLKALDLRPGYPRALYDLAENRYFQARGDCEPGRADLAGLRDSVATYEQVRPTAADDPDMQLWVSFGVGRSLWCLSNAGDDHWQAAQTSLKTVTDAYEANNGRVRDMAGEAYMLRGLSTLPLTDETETQRSTSFMAAGLFQRATVTSGVAARTARAYELLGYAYAELDDYPAAERAYARALTFAAAADKPRIQARHAELKAALDNGTAPTSAQPCTIPA